MNAAAYPSSAAIPPGRSPDKPDAPELAVVWDSLGPYHFARLRALAAVSPYRVHAVQIAERTATYNWLQQSSTDILKVETLVTGQTSEQVSAAQVFLAFRRFLSRRQIRTVFLPSYWPAASAALLLAARSRRVRTVMMNDSHAGTEKATGFKRIVKKALLSQFDAALVAGTPQARHFARLGMPAACIFTGYDVIDNDYFITESESARATAAVWRQRLGLPQRYILSLGRLVPKKNLPVLVRAYAKLVREWGSGDPPALVFVGSGPEDATLKELCGALELPIQEARSGQAAAPRSMPGRCSVVYFHAACGIAESPMYYSLADVFVLPSKTEEWGLVVNEAMACGLPVIVSNTAGCAEDLVREAENGYTFTAQDAVELAARLRDVLYDEPLRRAMGVRSKEIIAPWSCQFFAQQALRALAAAK